MRYRYPDDRRETRTRRGVASDDRRGGEEIVITAEGDGAEELLDRLAEIAAAPD